MFLSCLGRLFNTHCEVYGRARPFARSRILRNLLTDAGSPHDDTDMLRIRSVAVVMFPADNGACPVAVQGKLVAS